VLDPGTVLGSTYEIVRPLAAGGMGQVYEARHARIRDHRFVVKVLHKELGRDDDMLKRFRREAEVISRLRHPNIVQFVDFNWTTEGAPYIVMEYLRGVDLARRLEVVGAIPLARTLAIVEGVAAGLTAAHEAGITHRDLKPANIFLMVVQGESREIPKVLDFGISKVRSATSRVTQPSVLMGTPGYMAPEQVLGSLEMIDQRTDVFALAAIVYEMLAGRAAFNAADLNTVFYQIINIDPSPLRLSGVDTAIVAELDRVVRRGLAKQPIARYPNVSTFADALRAAADFVPLREAHIVADPSESPPSDGILPIGVSADAETAPTDRDRELTVAIRGMRPPPPIDPFGDTSSDPTRVDPFDAAQDDPTRVERFPAYSKGFDRAAGAWVKGTVLVSDEQTAVQPVHVVGRSPRRSIKTIASTPNSEPESIDIPVSDLRSSKTAPDRAHDRSPSLSGSSIAGRRAARNRFTEFALSFFNSPGLIRQQHRVVSSARRIPYTGLAIAAAAVFGGASYWYHTTTNRPGRIELSTIPADAIVLVDDAKVGDHSPVSLERPPGPYTLSITRDGYVRSDQNIELKAGEPLPLSVTLEPSPDTGFELTSEPPGGLVWLDGAPIKGASGQQARTDFRAFRITPGHHVLEIKGENRFKPWRQDIEVDPGSIRKVYAILIRSPNPTNVVGNSPLQEFVPPPLRSTMAPRGAQIDIEPMAPPPKAPPPASPL
jgi:serine/threonine protein kinase